MKKSIRLRAHVFTPALSVLSLACGGVFSQTLSPVDAEVVVTSSRRAISADQTFQSVTVITRDDIERSGAQSIMDLLSTLPGVNTSRSGGPSKATSVYVRGTTTSQSLVLVNGVRVSAAGTGEFDWNSLLPEQIEKIEVVRGPLASLYGSDAIGGVIQIFTRQPQQGVSISQTMGSYGTRQTDMSVGGGSEWIYGLRAGDKTIEGMQTVQTKPERFGSHQKYVDGSLSRKIDKDLHLKFGLGYAEGRSNDESGLNLPRNYNAFTRVDYQASDRWSQSLQMSASGMNLTVPSGYPPGEFSTDRKSLSWLNVVNLSSSVLSLGAETWSEKVTKLDYSDASNNLSKELTTNAVYGQYLTAWQGLDWQLGARRDQHNVYGDQSTFNAAVGKKIDAKLQLMASYGTAFRAPSANDLYWSHSVEHATDSNYQNLSYAGGTCGPNVYTNGARTPCIYDMNGNAALKPERSKTKEVGLRYLDGYAIKLNYFETEISDLITWKSTLQGQNDLYGAYYQPTNVNSSNIRGIETAFSQRLSDWFIAAQYTRLVATNEETGLQLDRRPKDSAALSISREIQKHKISVSTQFASERLDSSGSVKLAGYGLVNVSDLYRINSEWSVMTRLENILDKKYTLATSFGTPYASPGLSGYVTLRYSYK